MQGGVPDKRPDQAMQVPQSRAGTGPAPQSSVFIGRLIVISGTGPNSGLFIYNGTPGPGNPPILAAVAPGVATDPYGNPVNTLLNLGNISGAHFGFDQFGNALTVDSAGVIRIVISNGSTSFAGIPTPAIIFFNSHGAILQVIDPSNAGEFFYQDLGTSSQGTLIYAQVSRTTTDPVLGLTVAAGTQIVDPTFGDTLHIVGANAAFVQTSWATSGVIAASGGVPAGNVGPALAFSAPTVTGSPGVVNMSLFGESANTLLAAGLCMSTAQPPVKETNAMLEVQGDVAVNSLAAIVATVEETWHNFTGANSWAATAGFPWAYRLMPTGEVQVTGTVKVPVGFAANQAMATAIPAAYRPSYNGPSFSAWDTTANVPVWVYMSSGGVLTFMAAGVPAAVVAGDNISWSVQGYHL